MRIRKNAAKLPLAERRKFVTAITALKQNIVRTIGNGTQVSRYDEFVALHLGVTRRFDNQTPIGDGAHNTPAFLPWRGHARCDLSERLHGTEWVRSAERSTLRRLHAFGGLGANR